MNLRNFLRKSFLRKPLGIFFLASFMLASTLFVNIGRAQEPAKAPAAEAKPAAGAEAPKESTAQKVVEKVEKLERAEEKEEKSAAEEGQEAASVKWLSQKTGFTPGQVYWFSMLLNFGIIAYFVGYLLVKKLPVVFRTRTSSIQKGMEDARKSSEAARARLTEVEGRLSRLDSEIAKMRTDAEDMSKNEEKRILSEGEAERSRIVAAAQQEIAAAAGLARRELKAYAAELAVDLATKKIRVEKNTDQVLVSEFTAGLGKDGN
jgi:F-type H+-transporting ATPase subunit b